MPNTLDPFALVFAAVALFVGWFGLFHTRTWVASSPKSRYLSPAMYTATFWFVRAFAAFFLVVGVIFLVVGVIQLLALVF